MTVSVLSAYIFASIVFILLIYSWYHGRHRAVSRQTINSILEAAAIPAYRQSLPLLRKEISRVRRLEHPLAIIVIQLNGHLPKEDLRSLEGSINHSNQSDDLHLLEFVLCGSIIRDVLRETDLATYDSAKRQFVISLPESTRNAATPLVARLKQVVGQTVADHLSVGIVQFPEDGFTIEDLVERAMVDQTPKTATFTRESRLHRSA